MSASSSPRRRSVFKGFAARAASATIGAAAIAPAAAVAFAPAAVAQDCKLSVQVSPQVITSGQSAGVRVWAHFPTPPAPGGAYAFASSNFDVHASLPAWTFAAAGAIVGSDVLGISAGQAHQPQLGNPADPSNPIRIWNGVLRPLAAGPALVEIEADPADFFVYPSKLTSSSVERDAEGGSNYVFVNPIAVGKWLAAPGEGSTMRTSGDDVIVDGRIITGEDWASASVGVVPTGSVTFFDSSMRVAFSEEPESFTATAQARSGDDFPTEDVSFNFARADVPIYGRAYVGGANFSLADGSVRFIAFEGFRGGVSVAVGDLDGDGREQVPSLAVVSLPQVIEAHAGVGRLYSTDRGTTWTLRYDEPVRALVRGPNGQAQRVELDRIDIYAVREAQAPQRMQNNLRQLSLGCHVFEAEGVRQMAITPGAGR